jgi:LmbE family N-acetylglucosaminyl deacetylase
MLSLNVPARDGAALKVLCLGAHSDDIEIGCGATVLRLQREHSAIEFHWVVLGAEGARANEARESAKTFLSGASASSVVLESFPNSFFPHHGAAIKKVFEDLKSRVDPDLVFTHCRDDLHQDHRVVSELTWNSFRSHLILEYEIPKYDGDIGAPNVFVPVTRELTDEKIRLVLEHFPSQADRHWFDGELFRSLMRMRGMECAGEYAEAFTCRKLVLRTP